MTACLQSCCDNDSLYVFIFSKLVYLSNIHSNLSLIVILVCLTEDNAVLQMYTVVKKNTDIEGIK